jgi:hypothetical protein
MGQVHMQVSLRSARAEHIHHIFGDFPCQKHHIFIVLSNPICNTFYVHA